MCAAWQPGEPAVTGAAGEPVEDPAGLAVSASSTGEAGHRRQRDRRAGQWQCPGLVCEVVET